MILKIDIHCDKRDWKFSIKGNPQLRDIPIIEYDCHEIAEWLCRRLTPEQLCTLEGRELAWVAGWWNTGPSPNRESGAPGSSKTPEYIVAPPQHVILPGGIEGSREATMGQPAPESHAV